MDNDDLYFIGGSTIAILIYATIGVLTSSINKGFYLGTIIGALLIFVVLILFKEREK